jgi:class 3 adenylate cyclase
MNTASRLVDLAEDGQIIVSKAVYEALLRLEADILSEIGLAAMEPVQLKGIAEPQQLYLAQVKRLPLE